MNLEHFERLTFLEHQIGETGSEDCGASWGSWSSVILAIGLIGCANFSKFLGLNAVLVELDELSSGVPSFMKSDHGKLLRIAILCLVTWVSRGTCAMVS